MTDLDLTRYEGHTEGPWSEPEFDCNPGDQGWWIRNGRAGSDEYAVAVTFYGNPRDVADARLIADAPLLLAEVRRLRVELDELRDGVEAAGLEYREDDGPASLLAQHSRTRRRA